MSREALIASIEKWDRNATVEAPAEALTSSEDCPLCELYFDDFADPDEGCCDGCPIAAQTGRDACSGTPYGNAWRAHCAWEDGEGTADDFHAAARAKADFLREVLASQYPDTPTA